MVLLVMVSFCKEAHSSDGAAVLVVTGDAGAAGDGAAGDGAASDAAAGDGVARTTATTVTARTTASSING